MTEMVVWYESLLISSGPVLATYPKHMLCFLPFTHQGKFIYANSAAVLYSCISIQLFTLVIQTATGTLRSVCSARSTVNYSACYQRVPQSTVSVSLMLIPKSWPQSSVANSCQVCFEENISWKLRCCTIDSHEGDRVVCINPSIQKGGKNR